MKMRILIFTALIISFSSFSQKEKEGQALVDLFTMALQTNSEDTLIACTPTTAEFIDIITALQKEYPDKDAPPIDEVSSEIMSEAKEEFQTVLMEGEEIGIRWDDVIFKKFRIAYEEERKFTEFSVADIIITYASDEKIFEIKLGDCAKIDERWMLMDRIGWNAGGAELRPYFKKLDNAEPAKEME